MIFGEMELKNSICNIYGNDKFIIDKQVKRYKKLSDDFKNYFNLDSLHFFSTPGRTELGGNHTDHNNGLVLAGSINLDSIAVVSTSSDYVVELSSEGYETPFVVDLNYLKPLPEEKGTTHALIRGVAARLKQLGYEIAGFKAFISSDVLPGSGLSSSASIEVLLGTIFNALFNENSIAPEILAQIGQFSENNYLGKPCGLMDQMACAVGGIISIDFKDSQNPVFKKVNFDFNKQNYKLLVLDTGGSHADLTDDYSSIPGEMKSVASLLGASILREISMNFFIEKIPYIRKQLGDRVVLRTLHFLQENNRVKEEVLALESGDFSGFLKLVKASGDSSFKWLQNIFTTKNIKGQGISLALALSEKFIEEIGEGACRVHGGGFAGTIQIFLPDSSIEKYKKIMENVFGKNSVQVLQIRQIGTVYLNIL
ncbi:MAG: galactokinase [Spirochaetia bacterium]|jgi:galactokinase|nr:galactokinase [Spirochaetia bacterium]